MSTQRTGRSISSLCVFLLLSTGAAARAEGAPTDAPVNQTPRASLLPAGGSKVTAAEAVVPPAERGSGLWIPGGVVVGGLSTGLAAMWVVGEINRLPSGNFNNAWKVASVLGGLVGVGVGGLLGYCSMGGSVAAKIALGFLSTAGLTLTAATAAHEFGRLLSYGP